MPKGKKKRITKAEAEKLYSPGLDSSGVDGPKGQHDERKILSLTEESSSDGEQDSRSRLD